MYNVAIIDDEPWSREVVKALADWEALGLRVDGEAEDGTEGLRLLEERRPHVVVTDMRMPGLDGIGLLKRINERFPEMKIVVMSGYDDFVYLKQAIRSRAVEYLLKPLDRDELNAALAACARELKRTENSGGGAARRAPFAFSDPAARERYSALRQKLMHGLLELDGRAAAEALSRLGEWMAEESAAEDGRDLLAKVAHDVLAMLEEFAADNGLDVANVWPKAPAGEWLVPAEAFSDLRAMCDEAIEAIAEERRKRHRLDLDEIRSHIDRHYGEPISLETVAQRFFVSKEHLSRAFKSRTGENLTDYIVRKRMEKAMELMEEGKLAIKHVARLTGYEDVAYFYKVFKKRYGVTPGEIRRKE